MATMPAEMDMWAVVEHEQPLQKIREPIPEPKGTEVLIKVTHCGVCHSDLHLWDGWWDLGGGQRFRLSDRGAKLPRAPGHEILGNIEKIGPGAGDLPIGARRIVYPWIGCGKCGRCELGEDNMCTAQQSLGVLTHGGFAEYVLVPHPRYLVDPGDLDPAVACTFGCSAITTMNAVSKVMPLKPDEPVILIGAGGVGLAAISMLRAMGHSNIVIMDIDDDRLATAKQAGATQAVNGLQEKPADDLKAAAGGPILAVIDFVNNTQTATVAQSILAKGGKWVQVGLMGGSVELSLAATIFKAITIFGNLTGNLAHLREVTRLAQEGSLPPVPVEEIPWDDASVAMDRLRAGKVTGRLILVKR